MSIRPVRTPNRRRSPGAGSSRACREPQGAIPCIEVIGTRRHRRLDGRCGFRDSQRDRSALQDCRAKRSGYVLGKCHRRETDLGGIAVRQPRTRSSRTINMRRDVRPYSFHRI